MNILLTLFITQYFYTFRSSYTEHESKIMIAFLIINNLIHLGKRRGRDCPWIKLHKCGVSDFFQLKLKKF